MPDEQNENRAELALKVLEKVKSMYSGVRNEMIKNTPTKISGFIPGEFSAEILSLKDNGRVLLKIKLSGQRLSNFEITIPRSENIPINFAKTIREYFLKNGFGTPKVVKTRRP